MALHFRYISVVFSLATVFSFALYCPCSQVFQYHHQSVRRGRPGHIQKSWKSPTVVTAPSFRYPTTNPPALDYLGTHCPIPGDSPGSRSSSADDNNSNNEYLLKGPVRSTHFSSLSAKENPQLCLEYLHSIANIKTALSLTRETRKKKEPALLFCTPLQFSHHSTAFEKQFHKKQTKTSL